MIGAPEFFFGLMIICVLMVIVAAVLDRWPAGSPEARRQRREREKERVLTQPSGTKARKETTKGKGLEATDTEAITTETNAAPEQGAVEVTADEPVDQQTALQEKTGGTASGEEPVSPTAGQGASADETRDKPIAEDELMDFDFIEETDK